MRVDQAKRLKELERENARLKRLVAEQALDNSILREVASGNFGARRSGAGRSHMHGQSCAFPSAGPAASSVRRERPSATSRGSRRTNRRSSRGSWRWRRASGATATDG